MALRRNPNQEYQRLLNAAKQARLPFDREAWLNLAFYLDEQYIEWHPPSGSLRRIPVQAKRSDVPRPVFNKIMHYIQQERALALQAKPAPDVLPATDDYEDLSFAPIAAAYCRYLAEPTNINWNRQLQRAVLWALIAGDGWLKWIYNPKLGRPDIIAPSFFEVFTDPYAKDFSKARYAFHCQFMDREQVYDTWGQEVSVTETSKTDELRTELLRGMGAAPVLNGVEVNELWYKPCRRYPDGVYTVWAGTTQLVAPTRFPYTHGGTPRLPFTQIGAIERPDSMHYMSPIRYMRSGQMAFNKYIAQRMMIRENHAAPKWFLPAGLELEEEPNSAPNQVLKASQGSDQMAAPVILQPQGMADNGDGKMIEEQLMHIVGLHEVSQAQVPGRVEAAKAIELLKESDADRLSTMIESISAAVSEGFYQILMLAQQFVKEDVIVQAYSRDGVPEVKRFKTAKIKPGMRVIPLMGPGLARSRAARQDQLMNMWQNGIITDPRLMAELMEMPFPSFAEPDAHDMKLARNENITLADGQAVTPNSWDNHTVHLREHNDFRKTHEYLELGNDAKQRFEFHCQTHETMQLQQMQRDAQLGQLAAAAAGAPQRTIQPQPAGNGGPQ